MLLAKSCHDIDYIAFLAERPCRRVSSFGALTYFKKENAPKGSTERCTDNCAVESTCPYSAIKRYVNANLETWPANVVSPVHTKEAHMEAIRTGPYGRCVFRVDNDVVDHQVVLLEFEGDLTATFTMTAFTHGGGRRVRIHGTEGEIHFDEETIAVKTFADDRVENISMSAESGSHGGGDERIVHRWLQAIQENNPSLILTSAQESLRTHSIVFAAEQSRREKRMVELL
jgi:predicted dehydrogenase